MPDLPQAAGRAGEVEVGEERIRAKQVTHARHPLADEARSERQAPGPLLVVVRFGRSGAEGTEELKRLTDPPSGHVEPGEDRGGEGTARVAIEGLLIAADRPGGVPSGFGKSGMPEGDGGRKGIA